MEDDLTWLARNVTDSHMCDWYIKVADGYSSMTGGTPTGMSGTWCSREQIIQRRADLRNKPSWADAPEWANWLGQTSRGSWEWYQGVQAPDHRDDGCFSYQQLGESSGKYGEVLGDWRDTLERRPIDLSEPAGGEKERSADGAEELNAMAQRLLVALKSDPRSFDTGALAEMVELADAEIVKRDAAVCGGEGYLNNHWFERGELPPVGEFVDVEGEDLVYGNGELNCEVIAHVENTAVIRMSYGLGCFQKHVLSPSRTERDKAIDDMRKHFPYPGSLDTIGLAYAAALYNAGYRKQISPAK